MYQQPTSPQSLSYSPPAIPSPILSYNSVPTYSGSALGVPLSYIPVTDHTPHVRPLEHVYLDRVPSLEHEYPVRIPALEHEYPVRVPSLEHEYPVRVPKQEMSYLEYSQIYDHAYRNNNTSSLNHPILRPTINEKPFPADEDLFNKTFKNTEKYDNLEDVPLNLICAKRLECKPIEDLVRQTDLPLDLSTKS